MEVAETCRRKSEGRSSREQPAMLQGKLQPAGVSVLSADETGGVVHVCYGQEVPDPKSRTDTSPSNLGLWGWELWTLGAEINPAVKGQGSSDTQENVNILQVQLEELRRD